MKSQDEQARGKREPEKRLSANRAQTGQKTGSPRKKKTSSPDELKPTLTHAMAVTRFGDLIHNHQFFAELWDVALEKDDEKRNELMCAFAEKYSLEMYENAPFMQLITAKHPDTSDPEFGYCHVVDDAYQVLENPAYFKRPPDLIPAQRLRTRLFPVHIRISPLATKEEVIDYVAQRWPQIRSMLDSYHEKAPRIRERPQEARDQFIWDNSNLPLRQLEEIVSKKFPGGGLSYSDIEIIMQKLKRRRNVWPHFTNYHDPHGD
jgi:hypothetical protein